MVYSMYKTEEICQDTRSMETLNDKLSYLDSQMFVMIHHDHRKGIVTQSGYSCNVSVVEAYPPGGAGSHTRRNMAIPVSPGRV